MDEDKKSPARSISVRQFVSARTQELAALSTRAQASGASTSCNNNNGSSKSAKNNNSHIPYQHIAKHLRRRAVSHNVKRIPSRFRPKLPASASASTTTGKGESKQLPVSLSFVSANKKKKKFSRKHRRRKSNLLSEYNRRQRLHKWLETHIWHAKRFHMGLKWNSKIPLAPCEKGQRALYRSAKQYVTMQDISFFSCLELIGDYHEICEGFKQIAPPQCNTLSLAALMYRGGEREGKLQVYHQDSYPLGYIGEVQFMWIKSTKHFLETNTEEVQPMEEEEEEKEKFPSKLWLWVHPAVKEEFILQVTSLFSLVRLVHSNDEHEEEPNNEGKQNGNLTIDEIKLLPKQLDSKPTWANSNSMTLIDLYGELNRIRFYGPEILSVLKEVMHPSNFISTVNVTKCEKESGNFSESKVKWLDQCLGGSGQSSSKKTSDYLLAQKLLWSVIEDNLDFPSQIILPLIVRDPRVFLPQSRTKVLRDFYQDANYDDDGEDGNLTDMKMTDDIEQTEDMEIDTESALPKDSNSNIKDVKDDHGRDKLEVTTVFNKFVSMAESPLADSKCRLRLVKEKMTDEEYCRRRSQLLIPGSQIELGEDENQIPVILIERPSSPNSKNFNDGGFDLIVPAGWTMAFWIAFSYRAVRVCGLRDSTTFAFEAGALHSPSFLAPDSQAGAAEESEAEKEARETFFKLPPAKRANLIKLNCTCPFTPDWKSLLSFWHNRIKLHQVPVPCFSSLPSSPSLLLPQQQSPSQQLQSPKSDSQFYVLRDLDSLKLIRKLYKSRKWTELQSLLSSPSLTSSTSSTSTPLSSIDVFSCFIGVKLQSWNRGKSVKGAVICLPAQADFDSLRRKMILKPPPLEPSPSTSSSSSSINLCINPGKRNVSDPPLHSEPPHDDKETSHKRAELHQKHQKIMAYLRKKRKKFRGKSSQAQLQLQQSKKGQIKEETTSFDKLSSDLELWKESIAHYDSAAISKMYNQTFNDLWLVSQGQGTDKCLRSFQENSRVPAGFVVYGSDEYSTGKCSALGYITLSSLLELSRLFAQLEKQEAEKPEEVGITPKTAPFLLVRNWMDSPIYRQVKCNVLLL